MRGSLAWFKQRSANATRQLPPCSSRKACWPSCQKRRCRLGPSLPARHSVLWHSVSVSSQHSAMAAFALSRDSSTGFWWIVYWACSLLCEATGREQRPTSLQPKPPLGAKTCTLNGRAFSRDRPRSSWLGVIKPVSCVAEITSMKHVRSLKSSVCWLQRSTCVGDCTLFPIHPVSSPLRFFLPI